MQATATTAQPTTVGAFTGSHMIEGAGAGDKAHFAGHHLGHRNAECPHCNKTCKLCRLTP